MRLPSYLVLQGYTPQSRVHTDLNWILIGDLLPAGSEA
jgi:hypothetical protein